MMPTRLERHVLAVAFDVDGTIVDNFAQACGVAQDILALFGSEVVITDRPTMREQFGRAALTSRYGHAGVPISLIHPLLMRTRSLAAPPPVFAGLVPLIDEVSAATGEPPTFFTAGYADSARSVLAAAGLRAANISGREDGSKTEQLTRWAAAHPGGRYVCDTVTDVRRCRVAGLQPVGVAWGYDPVADLAGAGAVATRTVADLRSVLLHLPTEGVTV
ncbi:MAG: hypothetical protein KAG80_06230 [Nocardioides sp.]|nr:hypothetical protein [Nocardioides sp.]